MVLREVKETGVLGRHDVPEEGDLGFRKETGKRGKLVSESVVGVRPVRRRGTGPTDS